MTAKAADSRRLNELLTEEVYQAAWRYALRLSATRLQAEDLLQDALAAALMALDSLRDDRKFRSWLFSIIRHRFLDITRRRKFEPEYYARPPESILAARGPDRSTLEMLEAMARLKLEYRELLALYYLEGLGLAEAAEILDIAERGVRQRLMRARNALRRELVQAGYAYRPAAIRGGDGSEY